MHGLTVRHWKRYGHDRLYVSDESTQTVGWLDLKTGAIKLEQPALAVRFDMALLEHFGISAPSDRVVAGSQKMPPPTGAPAQLVPMAVPCEDLARREPGYEVARQAERLRRQAPVKSALGRFLGFDTDDRSWRVGAAGERKVADELDKLRCRDPRWAVLHSIPVGERAGDIDHLLIGPGGVFTLNTKHHPGKRIEVRGETFLVDGHRQPYIRNSRREAERAGRLLSAAVGVPVSACGVVVPVNAGSFEVVTPPRDVAVVNRRRLAGWLERSYPVLSSQAIAVIFEAARRSTTWTARWGS